MTCAVGSAVIGGQIEEEREITLYVHVVRDLEIRVRMMNARAFEERPITNDSGFFHARCS